MSFITTKVRGDGRFFLVQIDRGRDGNDFRDAHSPLEQDKTYFGLLLDGSLVGQTQYVEFGEANSAIFRGDRLEELPGDFRLIKV
jgi:hypothetical protein